VFFLALKKRSVHRCTHKAVPDAAVGCHGNLPMPGSPLHRPGP
jgi:hypothetical protein